MIVENNVILTSEITDALNEGRPKGEHFKRKSIGWVMKRLGFQLHPTHRGHGWYFTADRLSYLCSIYMNGAETKPVETPTPLGKTPQTQQTSPKPTSQETENQKENTECPFCLKPISEDHRNVTTFEGVIYHIPCYLKLKDSVPEPERSWTLE